MDEEMYVLASKSEVGVYDTPLFTHPVQNSPLDKSQVHRLAIQMGIISAQNGNVQELVSALNAMLTQFGMDEDEWSKPTFDQARTALANYKSSLVGVKDTAIANERGE